MEDLSLDLLQALDEARLTERPTLRDPQLDLVAAYRLATQQRAARIARGERPAGWKIGFTNRTLWTKYDVHAPIWGVVWQGGLTLLDGTDASCALRGLVQPRIEPEIVFRFAQAPHAGMGDADLLACLDWVAHGVEMVHCHYAHWQFQAPDTVLDFGLHGRLLVGPRVPIRQLADPVAQLRDLTLTLSCDGQDWEEGRGSHALGGPVQSLRSWLAAMDEQDHHSPGSPWRVQAGDIVTTGTLTDAWPVTPGQTWQTRLSEPLLPGLSLRFSQDT